MPIEGKSSGGGGGVSTTAMRMLLMCSCVIVIQIMVAAFPNYVVGVRGLFGDTGSESDLRLPEVPNKVMERPKVHFPLICAHRGVNDAARNESISAAFLSLCIKHSICCSDFDVALTSDRVLVVGQLGMIDKLFEDKVAPEDRATGGHTGGAAGASTASTTRFSTQDFTFKEIKDRDPDGKILTELKTIVDVALATKGMGKHVLITLDPKAATATLRGRVAGQILEMVEGHGDTFVLIAVSASMLPLGAPAKNGGGAAVGGRPLQLSPNHLDESAGPSNQAKVGASSAVQQSFAFPLFEKEINNILGPNPGRQELSHALRYCAQACPIRTPAWATHVLPSTGFLRTCLRLRYQALRDHGRDFYRVHSHRCPTKSFQVINQAPTPTPSGLPSNPAGGDDIAQAAPEKRFVPGKVVSGPVVMIWVVNSLKEWDLVAYRTLTAFPHYVYSDRPVALQAEFVQYNAKPPPLLEHGATVTGPADQASPTAER